MLERIDSFGEQKIRCEFPTGEHEGELYTARLSFCQNPICTCGTLDLAVVRDAPTDTGASSSEFHFRVGIFDEAVDSSGRETSEYDQNVVASGFPPPPSRGQACGNDRQNSSKNKFILG